MQRGNQKGVADRVHPVHFSKPWGMSYLLSSTLNNSIQLVMLVHSGFPCFPQTKGFGKVHPTAHEFSSCQSASSLSKVPNTPSKWPSNERNAGCLDLNGGFYDTIRL